MNLPTINLSAIEIVKLIAKDNTEDLTDTQLKARIDWYKAICQSWLEDHQEEVRIVDLERLKANLRGRSEALVIALVGKDTSEKWWNSRNRAFDMLTPNQMFEINPDTVYKYLLNYSSYVI